MGLIISEEEYNKIEINKATYDESNLKCELEKEMV